MATVSVVLALIVHFEPRYGQTNMLVYLGICSLVGSLTVIMLCLSVMKFHIDIATLELTVYTCYFVHEIFKISGCEHKGHWNCNKAYT